MLINLSGRQPTSPPNLIALLTACHQRIRCFTALALEAARREEAPGEQVIEACLDVERYFIEALPLHVADEEQSIEPRLRGRSLSLDLTLETIERQHEQHEPMIASLLNACVRVREEPENATARQALATAAHQLEREFHEHLSLEESQIFPAIAQYLSIETQSEIIKELRLRRLDDRNIRHSNLQNPSSIDA